MISCPGLQVGPMALAKLEITTVELEPQRTSQTSAALRSSRMASYPAATLLTASWLTP